MVARLLAPLRPLPACPAADEDGVAPTVVRGQFMPLLVPSELLYVTSVEQPSMVRLLDGDHADRIAVDRVAAAHRSQQAANPAPAPAAAPTDAPADAASSTDASAGPASASTTTTLALAPSAASTQFAAASSTDASAGPASASTTTTLALAPSAASTQLAAPRSKGSGRNKPKGFDRSSHLCTYYVCTACGWSGSTRDRHDLRKQVVCHFTPHPIHYKHGDDRAAKVKEYLARCTPDQRASGLPPDGEWPADTPRAKPPKRARGGRGATALAFKKGDPVEVEYIDEETEETYWAMGVVMRNAAVGDECVSVRHPQWDELMEDGGPWTTDAPFSDVRDPAAAETVAV